MSFQYSCFISYRREAERSKFIKDFSKQLNQYAFDATNKQDQFIDSEEIKGSPNFGNKIYDAISKSYFFNIFHNYHYLSADNIWCAKELKYAIAVEQERKKLLPAAVKDDFNILNVFLVSGDKNDLPIDIKNRNALNIGMFKYCVNKPTKAFIQFLQDIGDFMAEVYKIYEKNPNDFVACCEGIAEPTNEEILDWIKVQKGIMTANESERLPTLKMEEGLKKENG